MRFRNITKVLILLIVTASIIACSATPTRRSFKEGWKDSVVSTKVKFKLMKDKMVKKRNLDVDTWRGVVTLTGRVTSLNQKERAEQLAWQVKGVRGVDNFLNIVDDASIHTGEMVAEGVDEKDLKDQVNKTEGTGSRATTYREEMALKKPAAHPLKTRALPKVEGPVEYEDVPAKQTSARRDRYYSKPKTKELEGKDLTTEDSLARDAAEELRKLRGE